MEIVLFRIRTRPDIDQDKYEQAFVDMVGRVSELEGFVDISAYAGEDGSELAVARFESPDSIARWRDEPSHVATRERGRSEFFDSYEITIATQWKHYDWSRGQQVPGDVTAVGSPTLA